MASIIGGIRRLFRRSAPPAPAPRATHRPAPVRILPRALRTPPPPPAASTASGALGLFGVGVPREAASLDGAGRLMVEADVLENRLQVAGIVFYAAREPYGQPCAAPFEDRDDVRERIFRLLEVAEGRDVLPVIFRLPEDAHRRLYHRLLGYNTPPALELAKAIELNLRPSTPAA